MIKTNSIETNFTPERVVEKFFDLIRWWWENNVDYLRVNDPWVIPLIAVSFPLSLVLRAVSSLIAVWRDKNNHNDPEKSNQSL